MDGKDNDSEVSAKADGYATTSRLVDCIRSYARGEKGEKRRFLERMAAHLSTPFADDPLGVDDPCPDVTAMRATLGDIAAKDAEHADRLRVIADALLNMDRAIHALQRDVKAASDASTSEAWKLLLEERATCDHGCRYKASFGRVTEMMAETAKQNVRMKEIISDALVYLGSDESFMSDCPVYDTENGEVTVGDDDFTHCYDCPHSELCVKARLISRCKAEMNERELKSAFCRAHGIAEESASK